MFYVELDLAYAAIDGIQTRGEKETIVPKVLNLTVITLVKFSSYTCKFCWWLAFQIERFLT
ncbi:hypothetical protein [Nostoc linckia]|uniref:hypothetical protein n=1 Tax=Nostoc linckia TaxID=92942 RepID=UPI001A7F0965|nr:hypothetical protein [Nostoc linckia]